MRIVASSLGNDIESMVNPRFGRCDYFLVIDIEKKEIKHVEAVKNSGATQAHGAGIMAAQLVGNLKPDKIITGNIGPNSMGVLQQLDIEIYQASGKIKDAVFQLLDGKLPKLTQTVPGHFGMGQGLGRGMGRGQGRGMGRRF